MKLSFEKINPPGGASLTCIDFCDRLFDCIYHVHPEIEITQIRSGSGRRLIGDHMGDFAPGDLAIIGGGLPHLYLNHPAKGRSRSLSRSRTIQFMPGCFGAPFFELPEMRGIHTLLQASRRGLIFGAGTSRAAAGHINAVYTASGARRVLRLLDLLDFLAEAGDATPLASVKFHPAEHRHSVRLERAIAYITGHLIEKITLAAAAKAASMSPQGFSRLFCRLMGLTFIQYVTELRLGAACRRLVETDATVTEICFGCGFNNLSNFNRQFQRAKRMTPREYRRRFDAGR